MSRRTSIINALTTKFKDIDGTAPYSTNLYNNAYPVLKFWNEVNDFPAIYTTAGPEYREYHPGDFAWCFLTITIKVYCKGEDAQDQLETLLEDIETCLDASQEVVYDTTYNYTTTQILVQSIVTDEGLLAPYAVGELTAQVRFQKM